MMSARGLFKISLCSLATGLLWNAAPAAAQDSTWLASPSTGEFGTAANWTTNAVPTGVATFGASNTTALTFPHNTLTNVGQFTLTAGAPAYTFNFDYSSSLGFLGAGIVNHSAFAPFLRVVSVLTDVSFYNASSASNAKIDFINGTMGFNQTSNAGTAVISFFNHAALVFNEYASAASATINNTSGGGFVYFNANSTAANATITGIDGANVRFLHNATAGSSTISLDTNARLLFHDNATADHATITAAGGAIIAMAESATLGNATVILNSGALALFYDNSSGGNARIVNNAGAVLDMANLFAGMTAGSIEGAGLFDLGARQLSVGGNNLSTEVSGVIQGTGGALTKVGAGALTLSGTNTYTGATTVDGGTLSVNGSIATSSLTTVNAGGTLGGTGTVGATTISGGVLAPGNSIGTLTVQGNLMFSAASSYMVEVSPSGADRTNVTGTATLGGAAVHASFAAGSYVSKQYTIINASGGVAGTFGALVDTNLPTGFHTSLSYDGNSAYLNLAMNFAVPGGLNGNQQNVGNALTRFFNTNGGIPLVYGALTPAGLTQASGESAVGSQQTTFDAMGLFMGVMTDPFVAGRGDLPASVPGALQFADEGKGGARRGAASDAYGMIAKAAPRALLLDQRWSVWTAGLGGSRGTDGNAALGSNAATGRVYGLAVGADYRISSDTLAGFALAGGGTNFSVRGLGGGNSDLFQAGAFIRHNAGPAYLSAALAYGWQDVTTNRTVAIAGLDALRTKFNANAFSGRFEGGHRFVTPVTGGAGFTPYIAMQVTALALPTYDESVVAGAANTFALNYAAKSASATRSELGLRADKSFALTQAMLTLRGGAAWAHDFDTDRSLTATFQALPSASFVVNAATLSGDAALVSAAADINWANGVSVSGSFQGEFSDTTRSYAGKGTVRYVW